MKQKIILLAMSTLLLMTFTGCTKFEILLSETIEDKDNYTVETATTEAYHKDMKLDIETTNGDIVIDNWNEDHIKFEFKKVMYTTSQERAEEIAEETEIKFNRDGNDLIADVQKADMGSTESISINYHVKIPEEFNGKFNSTNGDITIEKMSGELDIDSTNGEISLTDISGKYIDITTTNGDIENQDINSDLTIDTTNGKIYISNLQGNSDITSTNGDVILTDITGDANIETVNGDITVSTLTGDLEYHTTNGDVQIE
ncbi:DUF4097 family beta strand repeat-containing protein [Natranaerobius thermophilus]|uniref:DUF4097 domain-containing protein n=1 Tax=Natranaerobius thermophilus (strain ATCC BAA-1301 / DSM 18059 / JW/NM-WN-LF) TaxID=457570 RepID=B2A7B1_NATTJ|nr:DUF4097 family beta strand repeat-containing protein [Natranaerobius thermophilus]ACB84305.1 hypothetical protein Nther_0713 [Natranaerobius thermophilus JW/NM-WN-LF]